MTARMPAIARSIVAANDEPTNDAAAAARPANAAESFSASSATATMAMPSAASTNDQTTMR